MRAMILFSGGLDSTTLLALAVEKYGRENVVALSLQYGQKHAKEIECAEDLCRHYGVERMTLDVSEIFENSNCSLLKHSSNEVPAGTYAEQLKNEKTVSTYVPYRNGLFLSIATALALSNGCGVVCYGAHRDDCANDAYPDCSEAFTEAIQNAIFEGTGKQVRVEAPFINMNKAGIVKEGLRLNVPYEKTWSCYQGKEKHCGVCATCIDRKKAFELNGVKDPTEYEN